MLHLFTVADRFQIDGIGCVLVPGLSGEPGSPCIRRGARIRLRTPSGREFDTFIKDIEMISIRPRPEKLTLPISLPRSVTKDHVPVGTEVLLLPEDADTVPGPGA